MNVAQTLAKAISNNSPAILTAMGVAGVFVTAAFTVKATVEAHNAVIDEERRSKDYLDRKDVFALTWKYYIPPVAMAIATGASIIGAHSVHVRREAALMSVYTLTEAALREYKDKVVEVVGENKERKIHDSIMQDRLDKNPVTSSEVIITGNGTVLCFESMTGRYFKSDHETIRKAANDIMIQVINDMYASHNEFCGKIGLPETPLGDQIGWTTDNPLEVMFSTMLADNSEPCLVIDYRVVPKSNYFRINS